MPFRRRKSVGSVLAFGVCLTLAACTCEPSPPSYEFQGKGLRSVPALETAKDVGGKLTSDVAGAVGRDVESKHRALELGLVWDFQPKMLRVYRATEVRLSVTSKPQGREKARCEWRLEGARREGCSLVHEFVGGLSDARVTLRLVEGDWSLETTKLIPLERLPVVAGLGETEAGAGKLPAAKKTPRSFRFALISDTASQGGVPSEIHAGVRALADTIRPELVFHLGGSVMRGAGDGGWDAMRESILEPLQRADIHTLWAMGPTEIAEGARVRRPDLELIEGRDFPFRYTFAYKGVFFLVFSVQHADGIDEATLRWLKEALAKSRVYESRFVMSYLPLNKFTDTHVGSLKKKLRLYEIFMRSRVTAFFTGAYRVYFQGRYGALPVVSTGALVGPGGKLSGTTLSQKSSLTVVDIKDHGLKRLFAMEGPTFLERFDESQLPESVEEVYSR